MPYARPFLCKPPIRALRKALIGFIHPSAQNKNSAKFASTEFCEVRTCIMRSPGPNLLTVFLCSGQSRFLLYIRSQ
jgi:hypothetical protein